METATVIRSRSAPGTPLGRLRAVREPTWARIGFALLCAGAAAGFFLYPTFPAYDSLYSLVWGRELLGLELPSFQVYRAPTQHPLAIAVGAILAPLGEIADRVLLAVIVGSFVGLVAGVYRLGRIAFTPLVGAAAALLLLTRLDFPFLAVRGYIDIPYLALVVWAAALEATRPRRGGGVWVLLAAAGLLRPEGWVLAGLYFAWMAWPAGWGARARYAALAALAPVVWALVDLAVTGDPLYSLHATSGLAEELGRRRSLSDIPSALPMFLVKIVKAPVAAAALLGIGLAVWLRGRRAAMPAVLLASGIFTFVAVGLAGLSVIERYLAVSAVGLILFAAVPLGGFTLLPPGSRARRIWSGGVAVVVLAGAAYTLANLNVSFIDRELSIRGAARTDLARVLDSPAVVAAQRCGPVSVPNHKLIPEVRWLTGAASRGVVARTDRSAGARATRGTFVFVTGRGAYLTRQRETVPGRYEALVPPVPRGAAPVARSEAYVAYVVC